MVIRSPRRLSAEEIKADREALLVLKNMGDYAPRNPAYSIEALQALGDAVQQAAEAQLHTKKTLITLRKQVLVALQAFHNGVQGARAEVVTQYGPDSDQVQVLGRARKRRSRRAEPVS